MPPTVRNVETNLVQLASYIYTPVVHACSLGDTACIDEIMHALARVRNPKNQLLQINPPTIVGCSL